MILASPKRHFRPGAAAFEGEGGRASWAAPDSAGLNQREFQLTVWGAAERIRDGPVGAADPARSGPPELWTLGRAVGWDSATDRGELTAEACECPISPRARNGVESSRVEQSA